MTTRYLRLPTPSIYNACLEACIEWAAFHGMVAVCHAENEGIDCSAVKTGWLAFLENPTRETATAIPVTFTVLSYSKFTAILAAEAVAKASLPKVVAVAQQVAYGVSHWLGLPMDYGFDLAPFFRELFAPLYLAAGHDTAAMAVLRETNFVPYPGLDLHIEAARALGNEQLCRLKEVFKPNPIAFPGDPRKLPLRDRVEVVKGWPRIVVMLDDSNFVPARGPDKDVSAPEGFHAVIEGLNAPDIKVRVVPSETPWGNRAERRSREKAERNRKGRP